LKQQKWQHSSFHQQQFETPDDGRIGQIVYCDVEKF
jgi:hypothetical protein